MDGIMDIKNVENDIYKFFHAKWVAMHELMNELKDKEKKTDEELHALVSASQDLVLCHEEIKKTKELNG